MKEEKTMGGVFTYESPFKDTRTTHLKQEKNSKLLKEWRNRKDSGFSGSASIEFNRYSQDSGSPLFMVNEKSSTLLVGTQENSTIGRFGESTYARSKNFTTVEEIENF